MSISKIQETYQELAKKRYEALSNSSRDEYLDAYGHLETFLYEYCDIYTKIPIKSIQELEAINEERAKALINDPEILLLDEPTASLDPDVGDYIRGLIEDFASNKGSTILLASHNMNEVERLCDEVLMMKNGEIIDKGKCSDLVNKHGRKNLEEVFLKIARE